MQVIRNDRIEKKDSVTMLFSGTHEYYAKYRPNIPQEVINIIVKHLAIKPEDRILDIGCGTGQVALSMDGKCAEMICLDPDPEMLNQAKKAVKEANSSIRFTWINRGSEDLGQIKGDLGHFKVATICRAFHWMNQEQVLTDLNNLICKDGGIAIFGDGSFWTGEVLGVAVYFALMGNSKNPCIWLLSPVRLNQLSVEKSYIRRCDDKGLDYKKLFWDKDPVPCANPFSIEPVLLNDRIAAQRGMFTVHGDNSTGIDEIFPEKQNEFVRKVIVPTPAIEEAWEYLEFADINEFSLFPDVEGMAPFLKGIAGLK